MIINYIFFHNLGVYIHITVDNYIYIFFFLYTHIMWIFVEPCRFMIRVYLDTLIHPPPNSKFLSPPLETCMWISMHFIELPILMHHVKSHYTCVFIVTPCFVQSNIFDNNHMLTKFKNTFRCTWIIQCTFVLPFIMRCIYYYTMVGPFIFDHKIPYMRTNNKNIQ